MVKRIPKMSDTDIQYALKELDAWRDGLRGSRLTWNLLEKSTGFSRQTLSGKPSIANSFGVAKESLAQGVKPRRPRSADFAEEQVKQLKDQIKNFETLESEWLERWARIAYHCRGKGFTIDDFDKPLPPANRR